MLVALPCARADENAKRREAGKLYAEAQDAAMTANYARAAELFERANALLPTPQALRAAIQVYLAADQPLLAISRAEELLRRYPYDLTSRSLALETIDRLSSRFVRVLVTCDAECTVQTGDRGQPTEPGRSHIVYVTPGPHEISARFGGDAALTKNIRRGAGQAVSLDFARPLAPVTEPGAAPAGAAGTGAADEPGEDEADQASGGGGTGREGEPSPGMPMGAARMQSENMPAVDRIEPPLVPLLVGGALTAGLGAAAVWSHRDAVAAGQPDPAGAEQRTRVLVGVTALSAASTLAVSIVWAHLADDDQPAQGARLGMGLDSHGYWVGMGGRF